MQYNHGGDVFEKSVELDFSININPLGMPCAVAKAIAAAISGADIYPDYSCRDLKKSIAKAHGVEACKIVCGNGASELIMAISRLGYKKAAIVQPTFSEYESALQRSGVEIFNYVMDEKLEFNLWDVEKIPPCDVCFLCSPNNPTGKLVAIATIKALAKRLAVFGGVLVLDECFVDFVENSESFLQSILDFPNVIVIRALTKSHAMAGVRLGYVVCGSEKTADRIQEQLPMWNVSHLAQKAGIAAMEECSDFSAMLDVVKTGRNYLETCLLHLGFKVYISDCNFILFQCGFDLKSALLEKGILIRSASNFCGLGDNMFRICVSTMENNRILIRKIAEVLQLRGDL